MFITANIPINPDKFAREDRILTLTGATWADYEKFDSPEYPGYRVSYFQGEINLVSPGRNHERIAEVINRLIITYCEKYQIEDFPFGQTRLSVSGQAGREPDIAYAFTSDKDIPDLAVEVIFSSGDVERLKESYQNLGIAELWIWKNDRITFYYLEQDRYTAIQSSKIFPTIESDSFVKYLNRGITESPLLIKKDFLKII